LQVLRFGTDAVMLDAKSVTQLIQQFWLRW
jgi:hypothetical protein